MELSTHRTEGQTEQGGKRTPGTHLSQVRDLHVALSLDDLPIIRLQLTQNDLQLCGFACAVHTCATRP